MNNNQNQDFYKIPLFVRNDSRLWVVNCGAKSGGDALCSAVLSIGVTVIPNAAKRNEGTNKIPVQKPNYYGRYISNY